MDDKVLQIASNAIFQKVNCDSCTAEIAAHAVLEDIASAGHIIVPEEPTEAMERASKMSTMLPDGSRITMWAVNKWPEMVAAGKVK